MKLILASTSKYRREQLQKLSYEFEAVAPEYDEEVLKQSGLSLINLSSELALGKAVSLKKRYPESYIIGSDQIAHLGELRLSKPGNFVRASEQLALMAGKTHTLTTSVAIVGPDNFQTLFTNQTHLKMRTLTNAEIESYLKLDTPFDCAGSYKIESFGISLFEAIETTDFTAIIGLPLLELAKELRTIAH